MRSASPVQNTRLASIVRRLDGFHLDADDPLPEMMPELRSLLEVDSLGLYSACEDAIGVHIDRWHLDELPSARIKDEMTRLFERRDVPVLFYDVTRPAAAQRNRLIEATAMIDASYPGGWQAAPLCTEVLAPVGLGHHRQHRMLLCEGAALLAWFGTFHGAELTATQQRLMYAVAEPLRRRLRTERLLEGAPRRFGALEAALGRIGSAAFLLAGTTAIVAANAPARRLLASCDRDVRAALHDALAGRSSQPVFALTEIRDRGIPTHWLAVARPTREARIATAIDAAVRRWQLTGRQAQVATLVVRGLSNAAIAADLSISIRATELHVTALLDRAGVDNRAALVATILL
jgi:DNA-binding CsgD family transcriptional regulator